MQRCRQSRNGPDEGDGHFKCVHPNMQCGKRHVLQILPCHLPHALSDFYPILVKSIDPLPIPDVLLWPTRRENAASCWCGYKCQPFFLAKRIINPLRGPWQLRVHSGIGNQNGFVFRDARFKTRCCVSKYTTTILCVPANQIWPWKSKG